MVLVDVNFKYGNSEKTLHVVASSFLAAVDHAIKMAKHKFYAIAGDGPTSAVVIQRDVVVAK